MRLYISGHSPRKGYAIDVTWTDDEIRQWLETGPLDTQLPAPVRFVKDRRHAFRLVERFNRRRNQS